MEPAGRTPHGVCELKCDMDGVYFRVKRGRTPRGVRELK